MAECRAVDAARVAAEADAEALAERRAAEERDREDLVISGVGAAADAARAKRTEQRREGCLGPLLRGERHRARGLGRGRRRRGLDVVVVVVLRAGRVRAPRTSGRLAEASPPLQARSR